jgi:hypothetical protein
VNLSSPIMISSTTSYSPRVICHQLWMIKGARNNFTKESRRIEQTVNKKICSMCNNLFTLLIFDASYSSPPPKSPPLYSWKNRPWHHFR